MAPKVASKRKREQQCEAEQVHWWTGKDLQGLKACFKKELALFLKGSFVDPEHWYQRKFLHFQRNYAEVPGLLRLCNDEIDQINDMVNEHIDKVLSEGPSNWKELMGEGEEMLGPFLLCEPEEHKGFLRIPRPERAGTFGSKDPHKQLPKELSAKVEHALFQWWHGNVRAWVVNAEQDCFAFHFSQGLWGDSADHVEIKVVGKPARAAVHFLLPHSEPLETLASMADEHIIMKWQERSGRDEEYYGSWLLEVIDGHREKRIRQVISELKDIRCPMDADPQILRKIQELERTIFQHTGWMQMFDFRRLIDLKTQCRGITEQEGHRIKRKMEQFFPVKRFASCNEELGEGPEEEYLQDPTCRVLPAPEDQQLLAHMNCLEEAQVTVKLSWIKLWDCELRVEVLARVPKDYKRPYQLVRMKPGDRINHLAAIWSDEDQRV